MKRRILPLLALAATGLLLCAPAETAEAMGQGLVLCAASVVPSLFPVMVLTSLFLALGGEGLLGPGLGRLLGRGLGVSGAGITVFFLGLLGGYPVGARLIGQLCRRGQISREEGAHLLGFCSNAGPAFILGVVGLGVFGQARAGTALYLIHAASAALLAVIRRPKAPFPPGRAVSAPPAGGAAAFVDTVKEAGLSTLSICAFVSFFYTVLQLFSHYFPLSHPLALGAVELTCGVTALTADRRGFILASALLGWGGLSVHCQTAAVLEGTGISMGPYWLGKGLQALLSAALAALVTL